MLASVSSDGIPIHIEGKPVEVPETLAHHDLLAREAYRLTIKADEILIDAVQPAALRNALATLAQLARQTGGLLPLTLIEDYPSIPYRGVMLDVSRGKIPNRKKLEEVIRLLASYKYNVLQLYIEDCYILQSHPLLSRSNGYYTKEEVAYLDAY